MSIFSVLHMMDLINEGEDTGVLSPGGKKLG